MRSPERGRARAAALRRLAALLAVAAIGTLAPLSVPTWGAFNASTTVSSNAVTAERIFSGTRTTTAFDLRDSTSGSESNQSRTSAFADGIVLTTGAWASAFSTTRYLDFDMSSALPGGLAVTGVTFDFRFASTGANTTCFYFETRVASTNALLGTHGSSSSPVACATSTTFVSSSTPLSEITSTDLGNDLRVRVYERNSASSATQVDVATVSGSTSYVSYTRYSSSTTDASTGTPTALAWGLAAAGDGAVYTTVSGWSTTFSATEYLKATFPSYVPTGANITSVTLSHSYRDAVSGATACWYLEVDSGSTFLANHGSASSPISCNGTTSYVTDPVTLGEVTTASQANSLVAKIFMKSDGNNNARRATQHDALTLSITYDLP